MKTKAGWLAGALSVVLAAGLGWAQAPTVAAPPAAAPDAQALALTEGEARVELGERFADLALAVARGQRLSRPTLLQKVVLLQSAIKMNPFEPRYVRYLADTQEQLGDVDGAIDAWAKYMRLVPDDHVAQLLFINLHLGQIQTNEGKLQYINTLLDNPHLSQYVKAQLAVNAVGLLEERSHAAALAMLKRARGFYPLPEVNLLEWRALPDNATDAERLKALLNIVSANPCEPEAVARVADILSAAGMSEESLTWYGALMDIHAANGTGPAKSSLVNYLAERYRAGETTIASEKLDSFLQRDPKDADFWFLRLIIQRSDESEDLLNRGQNAFLTRLKIVCDRVVQFHDGVTTPATAPSVTPAVPAALPSAAASGPAVASTPSTTQPADDAAANPPSTQPVLDAFGSTQPSAPDPTILPTVDPASIPLAKAIADVKDLTDPQYKDALIQSLQDMIWFEVYFNHKPASAAPWLQGLRELTPEKDPTLLRLTAWSDLVSGSPAAARAPFENQQGADPLSALGLFRLEESEKKIRESEAIGKKIVEHPHTGVLGALIWQATKGKGLKAAAVPPDVAQVQAAYAAFPRDRLSVIHTPSKFYLVRADPVKVGHRLGEPLLVAITLTNNSNFDVTIGAFGLIKPRLYFDAQIRGPASQTFLGITDDRIMGRIVLTPNESVTQTVRLDQGELSYVLRTRPGVMLMVAADVLLNAVQHSDGVGAGAGGYARNFSKLLTRSAEPLTADTQRRRFFDRLTNGSPAEKFEDLEVLTAYVLQYSRPGSTTAEQATAQQFTDVIDKTRSDSGPGAKIWASYCETLLLADADAQKIVNEMMESNSWESRLLALYASQMLSHDAQKTLATKAAGDGDPLVKRYAAAQLDVLALPAPPPATRPIDSAAPPAAPATPSP